VLFIGQACTFAVVLHGYWRLYSPRDRIVSSCA
jgi:hypothetical protein